MPPNYRREPTPDCQAWPQAFPRKHGRGVVGQSHETATGGCGPRLLFPSPHARDSRERQAPAGKGRTSAIDASGTILTAAERGTAAARHAIGGSAVWWRCLASKLPRARARAKHEAAKHGARTAVSVVGSAPRNMAEPSEPFPRFAVPLTRPIYPWPAARPHVAVPDCCHAAQPIDCLCLSNPP